MRWHGIATASGLPDNPATRKPSMNRLTATITLALLGLAAIPLSAEQFGLITYEGPRYTTCPAFRYAAPAPSNFDLVLNTATLGVDAAAEATCAALRCLPTRAAAVARPEA